MRFLLILMAVTLPAVSAEAAVYKCRIDGRLSFSDKPCRAEQAPAALPAAVVVASGPRADLLGAHQRRRQRLAEANSQASQDWLENYQQRKAQAERVRAGVVGGKVVRGMDARDVQFVLGQPDRVSSTSSGGSERQQWTYLEQGRSTVVKFHDGSVASVRQSRRSH